ncbi:MAG TPA: hypothetical protein VGC76_15020 [Pyrinomonadaceae bacterium]|jgi:hypothetical protein
MFNINKLAGRRYLFYLLSSAASFLIIFSRRPDAVLNPQFWAEDGKVWYANAYNNGAIYSFFTPEAGYYQTISRLVAVFAQAFPLGCAPLIFNLAAIFCKILVVNFLLSARFSKLIPNMTGRILIAFVYLALPHSNETHANLTNAQWHLALLSFLIIVAAPSDKTLWKIFDGAMLSISVLSGPFCLLLVPVAAVKWFKTRDGWTIVLIAILAAGSMIQMSSLLTTDRPSSQPLGANAGLFLKIVGGHLFLDAIIGDRIYSRLFNRSLWNEWTAIPVNLIGFGLLTYAFVKSNPELRLFIFFAFLIISGALAFPAISSEVPQWTAMWAPGIGSRYWLIPIFCCFASWLYLARNAEILFVRYVSILLLVFSLFGIATDWKYPRFKDLEFQKYAAEFENAPAGQEVFIPINPEPWDMRLVKKQAR